MINKEMEISAMEQNAYKEMLNEIPDFIFFHDLDGRFIEVNSALMTLLGLSEEDMLGHKVPEFIHPRYRHEFSAYIPEIIKKGELKGVMVVMDKSNNTHILEYHSKLVTRNGVPVGVCGVARDVSVQRRMEREIKEREALYRTLFENAEDAIFLMEDEVFIDCNPKTLEMFKCRKEDILQKPPYLFSPERQPDGRPSKEKALEKIRTALKGIPQRFEWRHSRLDGSTFDTIVSLYSIEVQKRHLLVAMVHDMTPQKKVQKALEESERKYREVAENTNVIILRYTPDGMFTFINRFGEKFFGYTREELVGKRNIVGTIIPATGENSEKLRNMFRDICLHPEKYHENENINVTKDGREVYIAWRNQPIKDEKGNLREVLSIGADITRTKELERELFQAKKLEAIGTLAGGIAHDFNNILGGIMGYLSLLKEQHTESDSHYAILEKIENSLDRTSDLVRQLLAFSRRGRFELKPVDMNEVVQNVLKLLGRSIPKKINIITDLEENLPMMEGDPSQMEQVIMNICLNGVQAMPEGGDLIIRTRKVSDEEVPADLLGYEHGNRYIAVYVTDTGVGMDKFIKEHIFEPFFTTKETGKGVGLGLSMVYGIVRNHGGGIRVESEIRRGTTIKIFMPAKYAPQHRKEDDSVKKTVAVHGRGKILVVDDEDVFREMMKDVLGYLGYDVLLSENGEEGIKTYREHHDEIDLVILDMNMPVMDGKEMFRELKKIDPNVKALLATGFAMDGEVHELMTEGVMGFIQKPFMIEDISKAIDALLKIEG